MGFEALEARHLMASLTHANVTVPLTSVVGGATVQEEAIQLAFRQASDLSRYTDAELKATTQWVLQIGENVNVTQLKQQLGVTSLIVQPLIPDTYTYTLPLGVNPLTIGSALQGTSGVIHAYPLVPKDLGTYFVPNDPLYPAQWHLNNTGQTGGLIGGDANVEGAWDITRGQNVVIAVLDTGTEHTHPDLQSKYQPQWSKDVVDDDLDPAPEPGESHGTSVSGIAVASTNNGIGVAGAAPEALLAAVRMLGNGVTDADLASAFNFFNQEIDIFNNSWGSTGNGAYRPISPLTLAAIQQATATGRGGLGNVIVFAAGNGLQDDDNANYKGEQNQPNVIAVANINHLGRQSSSSEPGDNILIAAWSATPLGEPGVVTTDVSGAGGYNTAPDASDFDPIPDLAYTSLMSGTSAAAPLVSGVVALMLSANPSLSWRDVKHILVRTAVKNDITDADWSVNGAGLLVSHKYGYGAIDAEAAVRMAQTWTPVAQQVVNTTGSIALNLALPDNSPTATIASINVATNQAIETVTATVAITHLFPEDVEIVLVSPAGTRSILASPRVTPYASTIQGGYTFSSTHFWGEQTAGVWRLEVRDGIAQDVGVLTGVRLDFYGTQNPVPTAGTIAGTVWDDLNLNGARDPGEGGIAGATLFIDANGNGVPDVGERSVVTVANGGYTFNNLTPGQYTVDLVVPPSYTQTFPMSGVGQNVNLVAGQSVTNLHFGMTITPSGPNPPTPPPPPPAVIGGVVFNDLDGDGAQGPGEFGIPNVIVYVDANNDNSIGFGELAQVTNGAGQFSFSIRAGTYTIRQANLPGWNNTAPGNGFYTVSGVAGVHADPLYFANTAAVDWGDAPASFPTMASQNGASHGILTGMYLGSSVDGEGDGQASLYADGDDTGISDDDDGVVFVTPLIAGQTAWVDVTVQNGIRSAGMLNAWIDFNGDNDWDDPGERIFASTRVVQGVNRLSFLVPAYAVPGNAYSRFRYGYGANVSYTGHVLGGEVEDHVAKIISDVPVAKPDQFTVQKNSVANILDVLFNDAASTKGAIKILATSMGSLGGTIQLNAITQKLVYTPAANVVGTETFTYTVSDSRGGIATTSVSVKIIESATPPKAVDDTIDIMANSLGTMLPLLTNDILGSSSLAQLFVPVTSNVGGTVTLLPGNVVQYTPLPGYVGLDQFQYRLRDTNGLESTAVVSLHVGADTGDDTAAIDLVVTDINGATITEVVAGQNFQLRAYVRDLRPGVVDSGIVAAFLDVLYSSGLVKPVAANNPYGIDITFAAGFNNERSGSVYAPGMINEIGASQGSFISNPGSNLLFRINFTSTALGTATFKADPADQALLHDVRFGNSGATVALNNITFGQTSINVVNSLGVNFQNQTNVFDVNRDGRISAVDALLVINELNARGSFAVAGRSPQTLSAQGQYSSMWDVDGDNFIGPTDAVLIINRLNSGASGEAPANDAIIVSASTETIAPVLTPEEEQGESLTADWLPDLFSDNDAASELELATSVAVPLELPAVALLPYLFTNETTTEYRPDGDSEADDELESLLAVLADDPWQTL